jgi:D-alanyl-D-alanine carboxypeptidase
MTGGAVAMKNILIALVSALFLVACGGGGGGGTMAAPINPPPISVGATTLQEALDQGVDKGVDAFFLQVESIDGSSSSSLAAGIQDRVAGTAAQPNALFRIASLSKLFIAAAATKMAHQGYLSLDDTLANWLPHLADRIENAESITLRYVIQHRSGIPDFDSSRFFSWERAHTGIDEVLGYVLDLPADFSPNARYEYSNTNYLLLAKILDAALGYSHYSYIQNVILDPLNMRDTYHLLSEVDASQLVHGYWNGLDKIQQNYTIPGGSMVSTPADVAIFLRALATGDLFDEAERSTYASVYWFQHSGWIPGYQSIARYEETLDAVVVLFMNKTGDGSEAIIADTYNRVVAVLRR